MGEEIDRSKLPLSAHANKASQMIGISERPVRDSNELFENCLNVFNGGFIKIDVLGKVVRVCCDDILVLSPVTFGNPKELQFGTVTHIKNPECDDACFQIRTDKHFWDFRNFYEVVSVLRPYEVGAYTKLLSVSE